jgi:hypothetical protein
MVESFVPQVRSEEPLCKLGMAEGHAGLLFTLGLAGKGKGRF